MRNEDNFWLDMAGLIIIAVIYYYIFDFIFGG